MLNFTRQANKFLVYKITSNTWTYEIRSKFRVTETKHTFRENDKTSWNICEVRSFGYIKLSLWLKPGNSRILFDSGICGRWQLMVYIVNESWALQWGCFIYNVKKYSPMREICRVLTQYEIESSFVARPIYSGTRDVPYMVNQQPYNAL